MATLFAANGGAVIGVLQWNEANQHGTLSALIWFAAGLVFSIGMGALSTIWAMLAIIPVERARLSIDQSLLTGNADKQTLDALVERNRWTWKTWVPSYSGAASLICLIAGMAAIAYHL
jgi:hypothetical protein